jgi:hypothetical protein
MGGIDSGKTQIKQVIAHGLKSGHQACFVQRKD